MLVTQSYTQRSSASLEGDSFRLNVATEQSRPPVRLDATIKDGLSYARLMLTLYNVVTGDQRTPQKDRTAYMQWVQQRYLDELPEYMSKSMALLPGLQEERGKLKEQIKEVNKRVRELMNIKDSGEYWNARSKYYQYLYKYDRDLWIALDPVVSVHPDCVIFEAFSKDESSYGRVTVPMSGFSLRGQVDYGTTNIDFSPDLAREIGRIRTYRPTDLQVGADKVVLFTKAGGVVEKKIDLPPTWVRGFLQVQSAATLPGFDVHLSAATLAEVLSVLKRQREDRGPRSLRFILQPGQKPKIVIEPWNIVVEEAYHTFEGREPQEVRMWGRRRLLVFDQLLAYATHVQVRLMGTGLPSYWSVFQQDSRIDVGLSGWTQNDWSRAAQFDLLASTSKVSTEQLQKTAKTLEDILFADPEEVAQKSGLSREGATAALQQLCREGRAMYDHVTRTYRWRKLFPFMPEPEVVAEDPRLNAARKIVEKGGVRWLKPPLKNAPPHYLSLKGASNERKFEFVEGKSSKFWNITLEGESHTVQYGRIGTAGQSQTKDFDTPKEAKASYEKLIKEKVGKGYKEVTPAPAPVVSDGKPSGLTRFEADVKSEKTFQVTIDLDVDGRVVYASCTCGTFRRDKLRKGPCPHLLATTVMAAQQQAKENSLETANAGS